jgi:hypothetical protein
MIARRGSESRQGQQIGSQPVDIVGNQTAIAVVRPVGAQRQLGEGCRGQDAAAENRRGVLIEPDASAGRSSLEPLANRMSPGRGLDHILQGVGVTMASGSVALRHSLLFQHGTRGYPSQSVRIGPDAETEILDTIPFPTPAPQAWGADEPGPEAAMGDRPR